MERPISVSGTIREAKDDSDEILSGMSRHHRRYQTAHDSPVPRCGAGKSYIHQHLGCIVSADATVGLDQGAPTSAITYQPVS
jgi:hypothetical protein